MYRPYVIAFFLVTLLGAVALVLVQSWRMHEFVARRRGLVHTAADLDAFKQLVRFDMIAALVMKSLLGGVNLIWLLLLVPFLGSLLNFLAFGLTLLDALLVVGLSLLVYAVSKVTSLTTQADFRAMGVPDEALRAERDRVVRIWDGKPWPDF